MLEFFDYQPDQRLTYDSFLTAMAGFPSRHPAISLMEQGLDDCPEVLNISFDGFVDHQQEFTILYVPGDVENIHAEAVSLGIVLKTTLRQIDEIELIHQTQQLNQNYPETRMLSLYSIPTQDGYKYVLGTELVFEHGHTLGEMDMLFDLLVRATPLAHTMFCSPQQPIFDMPRGSC